MQDGCKGEMDDGHEFDGCSEGASAAEDNGLWGG
jgi:hypothetical protein